MAATIFRHQPYLLDKRRTANAMAMPRKKHGGQAKRDRRSLQKQAQILEQGSEIQLVFHERLEFRWQRNEQPLLGNGVQRSILLHLCNCFIEFGQQAVFTLIDGHG